MICIIWLWEKEEKKDVKVKGKRERGKEGNKERTRRLQPSLRLIYEGVKSSHNFMPCRATSFFCKCSEEIYVCIVWWWWWRGWNTFIKTQAHCMRSKTQAKKTWWWWYPTIPTSNKSTFSFGVLHRRQSCGRTLNTYERFVRVSLCAVGISRETGNGKKEMRMEEDSTCLKIIGMDRSTHRDSGVTQVCITCN